VTQSSTVRREILQNQVIKAQSVQINLIMINKHTFSRVVLLFALLSTCFSENSIAQKNQKEASKYNPIYKVLNEFTFKALNDSIPLYAFNFKINVKKIGKNQVVNVTASDSLAYSMFPGYKKYYSFDFSPYMNTKQEVSFFIPILVLNKARVEVSSDIQLPPIEINNLINLFKKILYVDKPAPNILMMDLMRVDKLKIPKK